mmetsp:Transcript_19448/g.41783  ORF Transcript_19448/g.41783 Transcript_19448/m.41783 type:complete len:365 (+) Transcript_19448:181-1275(+)
MPRPSFAILIGASTLAAAVGWQNDPAIQKQLEAYWNREPGEVLWPCSAPECKKPSKKYEQILETKPGIQWMDHGGYCGSWSIQRIALANGVWLSQQQIRDHTVEGGGHDEEILETNIGLALQNLKFKFEGFDYKHLPTPQADAYRGWIKKKLAAGFGIVWMIMLTGGQYPVYPRLAPYGQYSHVEPVVGLLSDHPLTDEQWYDDDVVVHYTDADTNTYYRTMASLPDDTTFKGNCKDPDYTGYPCIYEKYGFGWSIEGVQDEKPGLPLSLAVEPCESEPDTRTGSSSENLKATVTIKDLTPAKPYVLYRWSSVEDAFDYTKATTVKEFEATASTESIKDPSPIESSSATYYRCLPGDSQQSLFA